MHNILITMVIAGLLVLFGLQNSEHVAVSFIVGSPVQIRLVFLLAMAAAFGFLLSYIQGLGREIKFRKQLRKLAGQVSQLSQSDQPVKKAMRKSA